MARKFVILALLLVAVIGLASAQSPSSSPTSTPVALSPDSPSSSPTSTPVALSPDTAASSPDTIGSIGDDGAVPSDDAVEAPVGAPVDATAFGPIDGAPASAPTSGTTMVKFSAAGLVLAVAGYFF